MWIVRNALKQLDFQNQNHVDIFPVTMGLQTTTMLITVKICRKRSFRHRKSPKKRIRNTFFTYKPTGIL